MRYYFIDTARAVLILLGIPYHAAMFYNDTYPWLLNSADSHHGYFLIAMFIHIFRMPAFYIAAGFLTAITLSKKPPKLWAKDRFVRLAVPLLFSIAFICIPQYLFITSVRGQAFALNGEAILSHLWFLVVLVEFSLLAFLLNKSSLLSKISAVRLPMAVMIVGTVAAAMVTALAGRIVGQGLDGTFLAVLNLDLAVSYAPFFVLGLMCGRSTEWFSLMTGRIWVFALAGIALAIAYLAIPHSGGFATKIAATALSAASAVTISVALFRAFGKYANFSNATISAIVAASFSIYLFHHPIVVVSAYLLENSLASPLRFALVVITATAVSYGIHLCIASSRFLSFAFNGVKMQRSAPAGLVGSTD